MSRKYFIILVILVLVNGICTAVTVPQVNIPAHSSGSAVHSGIHASPLLSKPVSSSLEVQKAIGITPVMETKENAISQTNGEISSESSGDTTRVSVSSAGRQGNSDSYSPSISSDGNYVAFKSYASNLIAGDGNGVYDIFVHNQNNGETTRDSVTSTGIGGISDSYRPFLSANGRYVAFTSIAWNLVDGDGNAKTDIFVHDQNTGETTRVSVNSLGTEANNDSYSSSISGDGRYVAFESLASNLVSGDGNAKTDIFEHDRNTGETTRVSVNSLGTEGNGDSEKPSISYDGRYVAFKSDASNLVDGDDNEKSDIFVHDRNTGKLTRVSVNSAGTEGNGVSEYPSLSADGRYVAFSSFASNLVDGDGNGVRDVLVYDRNTGENTRVSVNSAGTEGNGGSRYPSISGDGRYVAFESLASNLVSGDGNNKYDIFVHDRNTNETIRISVNSAGTGGDDNSYYSFISTDGRYVAFESLATNLVSGDDNRYRDIFIHDCESPPAVESITPFTGINTEPVSITNLSGSEFFEGAIVTLTRSGQDPITATGVTVESSTRISCTFPITGAETGEWNVVVKNTGGWSGILENGFTITNPPPTVSGITPDNGINTGEVYITNLTGTGFLSGATVNLTKTGQTNITATDVNVETVENISCTFPISGVVAGMWNVAVMNADGKIGTLGNGFTINNLEPTISSLSPNNELIKTHNVDYPVTVTGTNFVSGCTATLNGEDRAVTFVNDTEITLTFLEGDDDIVGSYPVVITNPSPSAGASSPVNYVVGYPAPTISSITPNSCVNTGSVAFTSLSGTNFRTGATVNLTKSGQTNITATGLTITSTKINGTFDLNDKTAGAWNVIVTNTDGQSAALTNGFTVNNPKPTISGLSPNNEVINAHIANYPVSITGTNFVSGCTVTLNGQNRAVSFVSSTKVTVTFLKGDDDITGSFPVVISNPSPSAGASSALNYVIGNPAPTIISINPASGVNTGTVSFTNLAGTNFRTGAKVNLTRSGQPNIPTTGLTITSTKINGTFNLNGKTADAWNVVVTNTDGQSATLTNGFEVQNPKPTISRLSPNNEMFNTHNANYPVTITGTNFVTGCKATLKGQNRAVTYTSKSKITVTFLPGDDNTAGKFPVVITNPSPSAGASSAVNYIIGYPAPTLSSVSPVKGVNKGTVAITLTGTNFRSGATVQLTKTGKSAIKGTGVSVKSPNKITCKLPLTGKAIGKWNVVVTNSDKQTATKKNGFTITGPLPTITTVSPNIGSKTKNTRVTISGTSFRSGATVHMIKDSTIRKATVKSRTLKKIMCILPTKGAAAGVWSLKVTNSDSSSVTKTRSFTVR